MNYRKISMLFLSLVVTILITAACNIIGGGNTYKIGLLSPQTGPIAVYAPGFEDAANVAIAELNDNEDGNVYELIVADSGCAGFSVGRRRVANAEGFARGRARNQHHRGSRERFDPHPLICELRQR